MKKLFRWLLVPLAVSAIWQPVWSWSCGGGDEYVPPLLSTYLGRLPGRSLGRILVETGSIKTPPGNGDLNAGIDEIIELIGKVPARELLTQVDAALIDARARQRPKSTFAVLHDLRDLFAADAVSVEAMKDYAQWRWYWTSDKPQLPEWRRPANWAAEQEAEAKALADLVDECKTGTRPRELLPHYLYIQGAHSFSLAKDVESEQFFSRVVTEFPDHPRAETALFMAARSAFSQTRGSYGSSSGNRETTEKALQAFAAYRQRYPQGRFLGDVLGWEGALYYESMRPLEALGCYAQQLNFPGHPELKKSAIPMCERCLELLCEGRPIHEALAVVTQDPALTTALVYHVLWTDYPTKVGRQSMLHEIAAALPKMEDKFAGPVWHPRFLAILAQALSGDGRQTEAMAMLDRNAKEGAAIEEWAFARAVVLERMDKLDEAAAAYAGFVARFPESTWLPDAQRRRAGVLKDMGKADEAVLALKAEKAPERNESGMLYPATDEGLEWVDSALKPSLSLCDSDNRSLTLQALFYGAPVDQLERLLKRQDMDEADRGMLAEHLARRLIAHGQYARAAAYLPADIPAQKAALHMPEPTDAASLLRMGKLWAAARGQWLPRRETDAVDIDSQSFSPDRLSLTDPNIELEDAIRTLGLPHAADLPRHDELVHALGFYRRAIANGGEGSEVAAEAMRLALDAMPVLARRSSSLLALARKEDWSAESKRWWQALQASSKHQALAAQTMYWSFGPLPPPKGSHGGEPDSESWRRWWSNVTWTRDPDFVFGDLGVLTGDEDKNSDLSWDDYGQRRLQSRDPASQNVLKGLADLRKDVGAKSPEELHAIGTQLLENALALKPMTADAFIVNALKDLSLASSVASVSREALSDYACFRIDCLSNAAWGWWGLEDYGFTRATDDQLVGQLQSLKSKAGSEVLADFWDALEISLAANRGLDRDWQALAGLCRRFLTGHPRSLKREAVFVHLVRAEYRARRPAKSTVLHRWNELGFEAANRAEVPPRLPWDAKPAREAIALYRAEFLEGALRREIDEIEGIVAWRAGDYERAISVAWTLLNDPDAYDKHRTSAALLANVVTELEKPEHRGAVLQALRESPQTHARLHCFVDAAEKEGSRVPLSFAGAFLRDHVLEAIKEE